MNFRKGEYLFALGLFAWICIVSGFVYAGDSDLDPAFGDPHVGLAARTQAELAHALGKPG